MAYTTRVPGQAIIVLGMGRSGTSYITSFLESMGVDLGGNLIAPGPANPRGFFEDAEIVEFHRALLKRFRGVPDWDQAAGELLPQQDLTAEENERAVNILQRLAKPGLWGWKDPRTIHFIQFWLQLLPEAKLIVPLRHPLEILYSYLKRIATMDVMLDPRKVFRAYVQYHERIRSVIQDRPRQSLILYTPNAFWNPAALRDVIAHFLDLPANGPRGDVPRLEESEFTRLSLNRDACEIFTLLLPKAAEAFENLSRRSEFRFSPCETPPGLRTFSALLLAAIRATGNPSTAESWLPVLLDLCRSGESPGYFSLQAAALASHSEAAQYWKAQAQSLAETCAGGTGPSHTS